MLELAWGDKPCLRKSTDRKAQISPLNWTNAFLICALRSGFSQVRFIHPKPPHARSLLLFPIVLGINLIHFFDGKKNIGMRANFFWQRKVWTHCKFQRHNGDHLLRRERQEEGRNEKCEFSAKKKRKVRILRRERREVWREKRKVRILAKKRKGRIFGKGKCKTPRQF